MTNTPSFICRAAFSLCLLTGITLSPLPASAASQSGTVRCFLDTSNSLVVGVWVELEGGGSGWANRWELADDPQGNNWSFDIPDGRRYKLHIGCGGTPARWNTSTKTSWTSTNVDAVVVRYYWSRRAVWS